MLVQPVYLHPDKHAALKRIIQRNRRPKPQPVDPRSMVERIAQQMYLERQQQVASQQLAVRQPTQGS